MVEGAPISVVIPTIGRRDLLRECLSSILACAPRPDEVLVVDQSPGDQVGALVAELGLPVVHVPCSGRGIARAINLGLRTARYDHVAVTNDDCTVDPSWVAVARTQVERDAGALVTGRVLPAGDPDCTPSIKTDPVPHDFTGESPKWVLYGGNMVLPRAAALALGGFDERAGLRVAAEDNDFGYRWMDAGRPLRYEPDLTVWHHDWRTAEELQQRYRVYARGQGAFYAKHLHAGDRRIWRAVADDLYRGARATAGTVVHRRFGQPNEARALLVGVPVGMLRGWREARRLDHGTDTPGS